MVQWLSLSMNCGRPRLLLFNCSVYHGYQKRERNTTLLSLLSQTLDFTEEKFTLSSQLDFGWHACFMSAASLTTDWVSLQKFVVMSVAQFQQVCRNPRGVCFTSLVLGSTCLCPCFSFVFLTYIQFMSFDLFHMSLYLSQNILWQK